MSELVSSISVRHNCEIAHRLYLTHGKCESIHGHSIWVTLTLSGKVDHTGKLGGLDFGEVKFEFRHYLDTGYDHRLLLNEHDPWAKHLTPYLEAHADTVTGEELPGLVKFPGDPTTENIAREIGTWAHTVDSFKGLDIKVDVQETHVNAAASSWTDR
jgi:6-pyruvoyltetrahydropterin/6-carboxytetrahydropterin synthase